MDPGDEPRPIDVTGSWNSVSVTEAGVPSSRYVITQVGSQLTGAAFWEWEGALERVGPLSGTIDADGNAQWVTTLNDNGWDGTERIEARFTGVEVEASSVSGAAGAAGAAATVNGTWEWLSPTGLRRDGGSFRLDRSEPVLLPQGTGSLGVAGPWRGGMFYNSLGDCHTTGFVMIMSLSVAGANVGGTVSSQPHPRGAALPDSLHKWIGYMRSEASGTLTVGSRNDLALTLTGDVVGSFQGELVDGPNATQWLGSFQGAKPCRDARGVVTSGYFVFNSERKVVY